MFKRLFAQITEILSHLIAAPVTEEDILTASQAAAVRRELYAQWLTSTDESQQGVELHNRSTSTVEREIVGPSACDIVSPLRNQMEKHARYDYGKSRLYSTYSGYVNKNNASVLSGSELTSDFKALNGRRPAEPIKRNRIA